MTIAGAKYREGVAYTEDGAMYVTLAAGAQSGTNFTATGQFLAAPGTAAAPGYAFAANPDTGFYSGATIIRVSVSGVNVGSFTATAFQPAGAGLTDLGLASVGFKRLYIDYTNTATIGAVTINKASGRVNIAAAGTSVVVTNSLVTAASHVNAWMSSADTTGRVTSVVAAAGSFTITTVAVTAQASFDFQVFSAD